MEGGGGVIEDNLCAFRCLAYHRTQNRKGIERLTLRYYREYLGHSIPKNAKFKGFSLEEIPQFENIFDIKSIYFNCSRMKHAFTFIGHAECIKIPWILICTKTTWVIDLAVYCKKKHKCRNCKTLFPTHDQVSRHEMRCKEATKYIYPGGYYARPQHIFEELEY